MDVKKAIEVRRKDPEKLRELDPPLFEAIIAELLAGFGWEVRVLRPRPAMAATTSWASPRTRRA